MSEGGATVNSAVGTVLDGRFSILSMMSQGGLSVLYKGIDDTTGATVTIRLLTELRTESQQSRDRFNTAVKLASAIKHPNVVEILASGTAPSGAPYLVLPYVDGMSLREKIDRSGPLTFEEALPIIIDIGAALQCAHDHRIIHRNLKPSNIILTSVDGAQRALLTGFGIAKKDAGQSGKNESLVHTEKVVGSPLYMSPEQFIDSKIDVRSDIYSFGCVIHLMLSGQPPFAAPNLVQLMNAHHQSYRERLSSVPNPVAVPAFVDDVLDASMLKVASSRYASVEAMVADLTAGRCSIDLAKARLLEPALTTEKKGRESSVKMATVVTVAGALLVVAGIFVGGLWHRQVTRQDVEAPAQAGRAMTIQELTDAGQYDQAAAGLENDLQVAISAQKPVTDLHERIGALSLLARRREVAKEHYLAAIAARQKAKAAAENSRSLLEDWACIGLIQLEASPDEALKIVRTRMGSGKVAGAPAAFLVFALAKTYEKSGNNAVSAELLKKFPEKDYPLTYDGQIRRQDVDDYLAAFVKGERP